MNGKPADLTPLRGPIDGRRDGDVVAPVPHSFGEQLRDFFRAAGVLWRVQRVDNEDPHEGGNILLFTMVITDGTA
jgi:hypothetical protein